MCPDGSDSCPNRLAKSLVTTASHASSLFAPPINTTRLAASLARTVGANQDNCASHTQIIETPNLDSVQYKARRRWIQAVLLWDAAIAEDFTSNKLKDFQAGLSYWQWQDSPSFQAQPAFQITTHGYSVDFAYQKVFVVPKTLTDLGTSANVASRLSNSSAEALQKVGAFATAASSQRASALSNLFLELEFGEDQLDVFRSSVLAAPVYFPFDISGSAGSLSAIALASRQKESQGAFPLPQICMPGLSVSQLAEVNRMEQDIFGLDPATTETEPRTNCTSRPTYGILNILNFQLPFLDPQASPQAVAISNQDRKRRMTFSTGPTLSPLLRGQAVDTTAVTTASFGISSAIDNVLFEYLVRLQDAALAKALVDYVVSGTKLPPPSSSELFTLSNGLASLPVIEAQLWGNLLFSDIDYVVSGIGQAGGTALFGSQRGGELRNWAHSGSLSKPIRWSLDATSSQYASDTGSGGAFQEVWESSRDSSPADIYANLGTSNLLTS